MVCNAPFYLSNDLTSPKRIFHPAQIAHNYKRFAQQKFETKRPKKEGFYCFPFFASSFLLKHAESLFISE